MLSRYLAMGGQKTRDPPVEEINQREKGVRLSLTVSRRPGIGGSLRVSHAPSDSNKDLQKRGVQTQAS